MMRPIASLVLFFLGAVDSAGAQNARCVLSPRPYGLGGVCSVDSSGTGSRALRLSITDSVRIWLTSGPRDQPPWRGNLSLPRLETSFEIAREETEAGRIRLVFRTGIVWLLVKEWRELEETPDACSACERTAKQALLVLDLVTPPLATEDDVAILRSALGTLDKGGRWDRQEDQSCSTREVGTIGLFCVLHASVESRMGRYHHRQPALELVRAVILERWRERITSHQLVDLNNHPATTMTDLRTVLELALARARAQAGSTPE